MFLYYMRRYHRKFIKTYTKPYFDGYWEYDLTGDYLILPSFVWKHPHGILSNANRYPYLDFAMREVQNRKEAFQAINLFMDANQLITDNTTVFRGTNGDENSTYVSLWGEWGSTDSMMIAACFVFSETKRKNKPYHFGFGMISSKGIGPYYEDKDTEASTPCSDSYYAKYVEALQGGKR